MFKIFVRDKRDIKPAYLAPDFLKNRSNKVLELLKFLIPVMNQVHNVRYSDRFWITILRYYTITCVNRIGYLSRKNRNYIIPYEPLNSWYPLGFREVFRNYILNILKSAMNRSSKTKNTEIIRKYNNICLGIRGKELASLGIGEFLPEIHPIFLRPDWRARKKIIKIASKEQDIFKRNVLLQMPRVMVEFFESFLRSIPQVENLEKKKFHLEHGGNFFTTVLLAKYAEQGARVCQYQLGGFIGETKESVDPLKYYTIDKHFTYGWKIHPKDVPFYAVRLEQFRREYNEKKLKEHNSESDFLVVLGKMVNKERKDYYSKCINQLLSINAFRNKSVIFRPRGSSRKENNRKDLDFVNLPPNSTIDKGMKPMAELLYEVRAVIHFSHPSTNFLECIFLDKPVIAILTNKQPTEIVKPFYDFFLAQGVLHENIESLVDHIRKTDIQSWWENVIRKEEYQEYKNTFARSRKRSQMF